MRRVLISLEQRALVGFAALARQRTTARKRSELDRGYIGHRRRLMPRMVNAREHRPELPQTCSLELAGRQLVLRPRRKVRVPTAERYLTSMPIVLQIL